MFLEAHIMKILFSLILMLTTWRATAQESVSTARSVWNHSFQTYFFIREDFLILPMYMTNNDWLHLEARYNYENRNTFSGWIGYNFSGGNKFKYMITPMAGGIAGKTNGIAPGLELDLTFEGLELYSENEYVFDLEDAKGHFFYSWTEASYSPLKWIWFGITSQWLKAKGAKLLLQPGVMLGGGYRWFGLTAYLYSRESEIYGILLLTVTVPEP